MLLLKLLLDQIKLQQTPISVFLFFFLCLNITTVLANQDSISLTEQENQFIQNHPVIIVGGEMDWPPYDFVRNGQHTGAVKDYLQLLEKYSGLKFQVITGYSWNELLQMSRQKKIDMLPILYKTPERTSYLNFTRDYLTIRHYLFVLDTDNSIQSMPDLYNKTVAIPKGFAQIELLKKHYPKINIIEVENSMQAIDSVITKKADALIENTALVAYLLKKNNIKGLKASFAIELGINKLYMSVRKDWPILKGIIQKALDKISEEEKNKIINKWLSVEEVTSLVALTEEEKAFIRQHPVISITNELDWVPYDYYENGIAKGYSIEYVKLLAKKTGLKIKIVSDEWLTLLEKFNNKEIDVIHSYYKDQLREDNSLFTSSYYTNDLVIISEKLDTRYTSLKQLYNKRVALIKGWSLTDYIIKNYPLIKVITMDNSEQIIDAVSFGDVDAAIDDNFTANYFINKKLYNNLKVSRKIITPGFEPHLYIGIQKDLQPLQKILQKAIDNITTNELLRLNNKWMTGMQKESETTVYFNNKEKAYLEDKVTLKACVDPNWMPLEKLEGNQYIGMGADYVKLFSQRIGVPITIVPVKTWLETVKKARARQCDLIVFSMDTPNRREFMNTTQAIVSPSLVLATRPEAWFFSDLEEVKDKKIGIVRGYALEEFLKRKYPTINFIQVDSINQGLQKVVNGELFGYLDALLVISHEVQKNFIGELKIAGKFTDNWQLGVGLRNDEPPLTEIFNKVVASISEKEKQKIFNNWVSIQYEKSPDYSLLWKIIIVFLFLFVLLFYRYWKLHQHKQEISLKNKELEEINACLEEQKKQINFLAYHDHLTGLPNRLSLSERLEHAIKIAKRNQRKIAILFIDLDRFKIVNDTLGHDIGDDMLKVVADRINATLRETDTLSRVGGDEFIILTETFKKEGDISLIADKILQTINLPIKINTYELNTTASIGIAVYPDDGEDAVSIVKHADSAMYLAKDEGKNNYQYFTRSLLNEIHRLHETEKDLRNAIKNNELSLVYQPQYKLDTKEIVGAEVLLRWYHSEHGYIPPTEFIPVAEDSGVIFPLGEWILNTACEDFLKWKEQGLAINTIAINVSSVQFTQPDMVESFKKKISECGMQAHNIEIEITERYITEHTEHNQNLLEQLRDIGFKISVDDFGTGYSSMSYLKALPLDIIKIDKSFINDIPHDENDIKITKAILALSKSLGYEVIAEGIETQQQEEFLIAHQCNYGQGYYFSKPLSSEDFIEFVKKSQP